MVIPVVLKARMRVNAICPAPIDTPMTSGLDQRGNRLAIKVKTQERCAARGGKGSPDEIPKAITFLASDDSSTITVIKMVVEVAVWRKSSNLGTAGIRPGLWIILASGASNSCASIPD
jgi:NAD(P)-dependent dehydrogenase (short-subunit alcohol dehydrogenase family)